MHWSTTTNSLFSYAARALGITTLSWCLVSAAGCRHCVDPFTDELAGRPPATTPSVDALRAAPVEPTVSQRPHQAAQVLAKGGAVTHGPLFFEDPAEMDGSENASFAWTREDYWHILYGPGRFLVSTALFPVSAIVTPLWQLMVSDGRRTEEWADATTADGDASPDGSTAVTE